MHNLGNGLKWLGCCSGDHLQSFKLSVIQDITAMVTEGVGSRRIPILKNSMAPKYVVCLVSESELCVFHQKQIGANVTVIWLDHFVQYGLLDNNSFRYFVWTLKRIYAFDKVKVICCRSDKLITLNPPITVNQRLWLERRRMTNDFRFVLSWYGH